MTTPSLNGIPQQPSQELSQEYGHQLVKFLAQMSRLIDFHKSGSFLFADSKGSLEESKRGAVELLTASMNTAPLFTAIASVTDAQPATWLAQEMAKQTSAHSGLLIDASSIVFAHSLLEAHLYFLCELCYRAFPKDWEPFVASRELKSMTVRELLSHTRAELLQPAWKAEFGRLERSLPAKAERLHELCKPAAGLRLVRGFTFSKEKIKDLDKLRHDIIHDLSFLKRLAGAGPKLTWVNDVGLYFYRLVRHKYGFQAQVDYTTLPSLLSS